MKTKIVLWGENAQDQKILLCIELIEKENLIRINIVPEKDATETFYNQLMNQWREGQDITWPDDKQVIDRPLTMTEGLLPDDIKTDRQDILARAKTEWHFVILSSKLYESYADEVTQIKERVADLKDFDNAIWEEMKSFWKKVQTQVQEKNLFREHASELRSKTNEVFDSLKSLKKAMNDEFEKMSRENLDTFMTKLKDIDERIEKGLGLQPLFNELRQLQGDFKNVKFTRKHHNDVWKRLDGAFKKIKEKRYGEGAANGNNTAVSRLTRRYDGLLGAIEKMERSIQRDKKDKQFQERRINTTDGQLELQIRQAKMAMIEERLNSKQEKLDDMLKTKEQIEKKIESEKVRAQKRAEKQAHAKEVKKAKEAVKENIANEIKSQESQVDADKIKKAVEDIKSAKEEKAIPPVTEIAAAAAVVATTEAIETPAETPLETTAEATEEAPNTVVQTEAPAATPVSSEETSIVTPEASEPDVAEDIEAIAEPTPEPTPVTEVIAEIQEATSNSEEEE